MKLSRPHGGKLIDRTVEVAELERLIEEAQSLPRVSMNARHFSDIEQISVGAFSPLEGFMNKRDYTSVLANQRLSSGLPWTIPVTLTVTEDEAKSLSGAARAALAGEDGQIYAILDLEEIYRFDREEEARQVLGTTSDKHPGVQYLASSGDHCLAGPIHLIRRPDRGEFANYLLDPKETRFLFEHRGWRTVVAFQTRNPVHRAH
jgi:sulfate adenylyltransferase